MARVILKMCPIFLSDQDQGQKVLQGTGGIRGKTRRKKGETIGIRFKD
jgi:hypothetical protein